MVQMSWKEFLRLTTRSIWGAPDSPRENGKGQEAKKALDSSQKPVIISRRCEGTLKSRLWFPKEVDGVP
jgi:hypothetical protein